MRLLCNIIWWILFGWLIALSVYLIGLLLTVLVVTAPVGLGLMEYGKFLLAPFSREMISEAKFELDAGKNNIWKAYSKVVMLFYVLLIGVWLVIAVFLSAVAQVFTIIGIPNAYVLVKSLGTVFNPVGKKCVSKATSDELKRRVASQEIDKMLKK